MMKKIIVAILSVTSLLLLIYFAFPKGDEYLVEYTQEEINWLEQQQQKPIYYACEKKIENFEEIATSIGLLTKLKFIEVETNKEAIEKNGIIYTLEEEQRYDNFPDTRTIEQVKLGVYTMQQVSSRLDSQGTKNSTGDNTVPKTMIKKIAVLEEVFKRIDAVHTYQQYEFVIAMSTQELFEVVKVGDADAFINIGIDPVILDSNNQPFIRVDMFYAYNESLKIEICSNTEALHSILNKTIDYIYNQNIIESIRSEKLKATQKSIFQALLSDEEKEYILNKQVIVVGVEELEPHIVTKDTQVYGLTVGILEQIKELTSIDIKYITGEKDKIIEQQQQLNLDLIWLNQPHENEFSSSFFLMSHYVIVGKGSIPEINSTIDLQQYRIGILFNEGSDTTVDDYLNRASILYFSNYETLLAGLNNAEVDVVVLSRVALEYFEKNAQMPELDVRIELPVEYKTQLSILKQDETLLSIINKVILIQDLDRLKQSSLASLPINQESNLERQLYLIGFIMIIIISIVGFLMMRNALNKREKRQMNYLFTHDQLTHLPNRFGASKLITKLIDERKSFAMFAIELDQIKEIKDRLGHQYGDRVIIEYSNELLNIIEETVVLARTSSEEFTLVAMGKEQEVIDELLYKIKRVTHQFEEDRPELYEFSVTIAIIQYPNHGDDIEVLFKYAEYTLDYAKQHYGKNSSLFFSYDLHHIYNHEKQMVDEIKRGIELDEFVLFCQPQINLVDRKTVGGEILIRWNHPQKGMVYPNEFIYIAEKNGLMRELDYYIIRKTIMQIAKWQKQYSMIKISVNLTTTTFEDEKFITHLSEMIEQVDIDPSWLAVEVTENMGFDTMENANQIFKELKALGVKIALDDFGKGYSSLSYLEHLKFDILKIDKVFIDHIHLRKESYEIFKAILKLAQILNISVVAEGVEVEEQVKILEEDKDIIVQGYYFSKPLQIEEFEHYYLNSFDIG